MLSKMIEHVITEYVLPMLKVRLKSMDFIGILDSTTRQNFNIVVALSECRALPRICEHNPCSA